MAGHNKIVYENIRAEMGRQRLTLVQLSKNLGINRDTLSRKLSGSAPIHLTEAYRIAKIGFPGCSVEYLFKECFENEKEA